MTAEPSAAPSAPHSCLILRARIAVVIAEDDDVDEIETALARGIAAAANAEGLTLRQLQLAPTADPQWMFEGPPDHAWRGDR